MWILNQLLNDTFAAGSPVRPGDVSRVVGSVAQNIIGRDLAFDYIRQNWSFIKEWCGVITGICTYLYIVSQVRRQYFHIQQDCKSSDERQEH